MSKALEFAARLDSQAVEVSREVLEQTSMSQQTAYLEPLQADIEAGAAVTLSAKSNESMIVDLAKMRSRFQAIASESTDAIDRQTAQLNVARTLRQEEIAASLSSRMAGPRSQKAREGQFPYQVALVFSGFPSPKDGQFCGGSFLDGQWVLTAAHCFRTTTKPVDVEVFFGSSRLSSGGQREKVDKIVRHKDYNRKTHANDIALVKLLRPVSPPATVVLPVSNAVPDQGSGVVAGWGDTFFSAFLGSDDLLFVRMNIVPLQACNAPGDYNGVVGAGMFCAGDEEGDSCKGDSGGAFVDDEAGSRTQLGIVSWGDGCAAINKPGVYTAVGSFLDWIRKEKKP